MAVSPMGSRRIARAIVAVIAVCAPSIASVARAEGRELDLQALRPSARPGSGLLLEGADPLPSWVFAFSLFASHARNVLRATDTDGGSLGRLLDTQTAALLSVALGLPSGWFVEMFGAFPVAAEGDAAQLGVGDDAIQGSGLGDARLRVGGSFALAEGVRAVGLAWVGLPIGTADFASEPATTFGVRGGLDVELRSFTLRANLGFRARPEDARIGTTSFGDELEYGAGLIAKVSKSALRFSIELGGAISASFGDEPSRYPSELLGSAVFAPAEDVELVAGVGLGLSDGYATPGLRGVLGLRIYPHVHDVDGDGVEDDRDRCPRAGEDRDGVEDEDGCPEEDDDPDEDDDGLLDLHDRCPEDPEDPDGFEDADGCPELDNDGDGVLDTNDGALEPGGRFGICRAMPETPGGEDANTPDGCPDSAVRLDVDARRIRVPEVYFGLDEDVILEQSFADLAEVGAILAANTWIRRLVIEGHTDDRGTDDYNLDLSRRRAASVARFLVERGVETSRLEPVGFGRSRPPSAEEVGACAEPTSEGCRNAARRVVFVIRE